MERKEPTLTTGAPEVEVPAVKRETVRERAPEREPVEPRQPRRELAVETAPPRRNASYAQETAPAPASKTGQIALGVAVVAVLGAGVLGWLLSQAQQALVLADTRITGLEQQLNMTSEESTASVVTLQANLKKFESAQQQLAAKLEATNKALATTTEKLGAAERNIAQLTKDRDVLTAGVADVKKLASAQAASVTAAVAKADTLATAITQQQQQQQNLTDELSKVRMEMADADAINSRLKTHDEAIKSIDEFRRTTNREIIQIKQQMMGN